MKRVGIVVDNFAGGGGASSGLEMALGRSVDIAINHDPEAIRMHKTNHPNTKHFCENVWDVDPLEVCEGKEVDVAWFSPDCKHFSRAKGKVPANKNIRGLAWVALRWAGLVRPKVIFLENVSEFQSWGPIRKGKPIKSKAGITFHKFIGQLKSLGYDVKYRELSAADYGAPTSRKRFFLIARCDGKPIIWPESTHSNPVQLEVALGLKRPWVAASTIIDWSVPTKSIFEREKPLKENSLLRIARGIQKFVVENEPYIVNDKAYFLTHYYTHLGKETRGSSLSNPIATISTSNRFGLVSVALGDISLPVKEGVMAFLVAYYGGGDTGQSLNNPLRTITTKDRFGLVTVHGKDYKIMDIGLRMLAPRELYNGMSFPKSYIIDRDYTGKPYTHKEQVARCGNAVVPVLAAAIVRGNIKKDCKLEIAI